MIQPKEEGLPLGPKEIEEIAKLMYNRYMYEYAILPQWNDQTASSIRKELIKHVKRSLDALKLLGYKVHK